MVENFDVVKKLSKEEFVFADDGFKGYTDYNIITTSTPTSVSDEENYRKKFKGIRVIVENAIAQVKKWRICATTFRTKVKNLQGALDEHHKIWLICVGLVNRFVSLR
jgi:hypothetical protein